VTWAASVPQGEIAVVRERIARSRNSEALLESLSKELMAFPVRDVSRHRLLLSTVGELKNPHAASTLIKFIWHEGTITVHDPQPRTRRACSFETDGDDLLRARAAEMLSHLGSEQAEEATLEIAARHPASFVRAAAIDAHMFNAGDSGKSAAQLRDCIRPDDLWRVGLPRMKRDMDALAFEKAVLTFYQRYPEHHPPAPAHHHAPGPPSRSWHTATRKGEA
jgi:hypothetical protein